jgi:hypothetical protein
MQSIRGKNLKATVYDISEGYLIINPLVLKALNNDGLKGIYSEIGKVQAEIRRAKFPHKDTAAIRLRNLRLQRLHSAVMIVRNYARSRKIILV